MKKTNKVNSLYIHIPFCQAICHYCDFPKLQYFRIFAEKYIDKLIKEIKGVVTNKDLETIYIGGGTPTSLDDDLFEKLLSFLSSYSNRVKEYTIEANPESLSESKIKLIKKYGVNRISIGVESTNDKILESIGRKHTFKDVKKVVAILKLNGLDNINLDLILGLPGVSQEMVKTDLDNILMLEPKHISTYSLTIHEHTMFYLKGVNEPSEEFSRDLYDLVHDTLLKHGYEHYEISNFAFPNYRSRHNLTYWRNKEYFGVGLGAAGYIKNVRYKNTTNLVKYLKGEYVEEKEELNQSDIKLYQIMLNLRTVEGLDLNEYKLLFNKDLYIEKKKEIDEFIAQKHLFICENHLIPTYSGMMILDQIILKLI